MLSMINTRMQTRTMTNGLLDAVFKGESPRGSFVLSDMVCFAYSWLTFLLIFQLSGKGIKGNNARGRRLGQREKRKDEVEEDQAGPDYIQMCLWMKEWLAVHVPPNMIAAQASMASIGWFG